MKSAALRIDNLHASIEDKPVLKGVNLTIEKGKIHALMGPNGSGKSTLSYTLLGHPKYIVNKGKVLWGRKDILKMAPHERAQSGLFLAFQYPQEIAGVSLGNFLRTAVNSIRGAQRQKQLSIIEFRRLMKEKMKLLKMKESFANRYLNQGFSGGEKKRAEVLQMALLSPEMAVMDETDSGLDIDALRTVSVGIKALKKEHPDMSVLLITHYQRILNHLTPDYVHVMMDGRIVESGGQELAKKLEAEGYDWLAKRDRS